MTTQIRAEDRATVRRVELGGVVVDQWVVTSPWHGTHEVVTVLPAEGIDGEAGWAVTWGLEGGRSEYDWSETREGAVASAIELAEGRRQDLEAEVNYPAEEEEDEEEAA